MTDTSPSHPAVPRRAADLRRLLRRETRRVAAPELALYVHGSAGTVRVSDPATGGRATAEATAALAALRELPDGAGPAAAIEAVRSAT